jgi:hypothetical protein
MLNVDFIEDVQLLTGGFGAEYGNCLSSVVDIRYREGKAIEDMAGYVVRNPTPRPRQTQDAFLRTLREPRARRARS